MQTFVIEIEDGRRPSNLHEAEVPDLTAARMEAARLLSMVIKHEPETFWASNHWQLRIRDEHGVVLFQLHASANASATKPR